MTKFRIVLSFAAATVVIALAVAAMLGLESVVLIILGALACAVLALQFDNRRALTRRIQHVGIRIERRLARVTPKSAAASTSHQAFGTPPTAGQRATGAAANVNEVSPDETSALSVDEILASGVFDLEFYSLQSDWPFTDARMAVEHYLREGRKLGYLPHPLFSPPIVDGNEWRKSDTDPLLRYLRSPEAARSTRTHVLFDPAFLDLGDIAEHETPLEWFLRTQSATTALPARPTLFPSSPTLPDLRRQLVDSYARFRQDLDRYRPQLEEPKPPATERWVAKAIAAFERTDSTPLVSVVLPTWNRAGTLRAAIESVQGQTYHNWELIVADDGSTDDTALVLEAAALRDPRIRPLSLPHRGVSAARNGAIRVARGEYIAFLDSDKVWDPSFLLTMLAVIETDNHEAAVAACEITIGRRVFYRSVQPTVETLRVGNSVDQTALIARRSRILDVGGFDESLRRAVDYDLVLKLAETCHIQQVPYVGVRYSEDNTDPNRISEFESRAWNFYVSDRAAWLRFESGSPKEPVQGLLTVIVDRISSPQDIDSVLSELLEASAQQALELVLLAERGEWWVTAILSALELAPIPIRVPQFGKRSDRPAILNAAIRDAHGEFTLVLDAAQRIVGGDLRSLVARARTSAAVHPVTLGKTLLIDAAGAIYPEFGMDPVPFLNGLPVDVIRDNNGIAVPGAPLPLLARTASLRRAHGFNSRLGRLWVDIDLSQRLADATGLPVIGTTDAVFQNTSHPWTRRNDASHDDVRVFRELWPTPPPGSREAMDAVDVHAEFTGFDSVSSPQNAGAWTSAIWMPGMIETQARPESLRWAIRTAAPSDARAANWGDFHFAQSLATALRALGQTVHVDYQSNALRGTAHFEDVVVNLRGLRAIPLPSNATNVLWVISHPEQVGAKELEAYDLRYAASASWSRQVTEQWGQTVHALLQCTDPERFFPDEELLDELRGSIVMVGNSRKQYRPAAWHVANAGHPVRIWGTDWEDQVPAETIAGTNVPNEVLRRHYRSAAWVLNDHWPDMREDGFISNRIFDVVASGGRIVTDAVAGLDDVFGDRLQVFNSPAELLEIISGNSSDAYPGEVLETLSREVREQHSFHARAQRLLDDVIEQRARKSGR